MSNIQVLYQLLSHAETKLSAQRGVASCQLFCGHASCWHSQAIKLLVQLRTQRQSKMQSGLPYLDLL